MDPILNSIRTNCTKTTPYDTSLATTGNGESLTSANINQFGHRLIEGSASHQSILDSHANSATNALIYIGIVLLMYILAMAFIVMRYMLMKSHSKSQHPSPPYYFGGAGKNRGTTTTTGTTTLGGTSVTNFGGGGASTCIEGEDVTPPEIRFIETEL